MSLRCIFRRHQQMLTSIVKREHGYAALREHCGIPLERAEGGRWTASRPLVSRARRTA